MKFQFYGATDLGRKRELNEDRFLILDKERVLIVCDGMGGHAAGEVASSAATETIETIFNMNQERIRPLLTEMDDSLPETAQKLISAIRLANRRIYNMALENTSQRGMGTTVVALAVTPGGQACIAHVGDSRAYRMRNGKIEPLTVDHSFVAELVQDREITEEEAKTFGPKNVITRALGTKYAVKVDLRIEPLQDGDLFLLCSDGLSGQVENMEIERILSDSGGDLKMASDRLIQMANETGGQDNITVALLQAQEILEEGVPVEGTFSQTLPEETSILQGIEDSFIGELSGRKQKKRKPNVVMLSAIGGILLLFSLLGLLLLQKSPPKENNKLSPSFSYLEVKTSPWGATLYLDGEPYPIKTPVLLENLPIGSRHDLRLELEGYLPENFSLEIPSEGIVKEIHFRPEVVVTVTYWEERYDDAILRIDGMERGRLSQLKGNPYPLSKGIHSFEIVNPKGEILFSRKDQEISAGKKVAIVPDERNPDLQFSIE